MSKEKWQISEKHMEQAFTAFVCAIIACTILTWFL